jgi:cobalt-zinc-cadmium efflux system membrane fusion protein
MKTHYKNILALPSLAVLIFSCSNNTTVVKDEVKMQNENQIQLSSEQLKNIDLAIAKPQLMNASRTIEFNGKLEPAVNQAASVCLPLGGFISQFKVIPGQFVAKGDVLLEAQNELFIQLQQEYLIVKNEVLYAEKENERQSILNEASAVSSKNADVAKQHFISKKIELKSLSEKLQLIGVNPATLNEGNISRIIEVKSPISGVVSQVNISAGKLVKPEDVVIEILNHENLVAKLQIFANDINNLKDDMSIELYSNESDEKIAATIVSINRNLNQNGSAELYCKPSKTPNTWAPGMYINGSIQAENISGIIVPNDAIVMWEGKSYVFEHKKANDVYELLEVQAREMDEINSELLVTPEWIDKDIVTKGAYTLLMTIKNKGE